MICEKCEALNALIDGYRRERDEARVLNAEWAKKAATWIASPEAAQRLDGYRDLAQQVAEAQRERDEARAEVERLSESARAAWEAECIMRGQRDEAQAEVERWKAQHLESQHNGAREAIARKCAEAEVERLSRLENSLPASLRDAHVEVEHLRSQVAELTRERDEAQATVAQLRADVRNLAKALRGYHRAADSWPYARWSAEMHAAEAALESVGMARRK